MSGFSKVRRQRRPAWAAASVIVLALSACGGGGGGGIASIPNPPQAATPAPTPSPTPAAATAAISAPARATIAGSAAPVLASDGGPNFTSDPAAGTVFPLLQTTMVYDDRSAKADATVNAAGGTATVEAGELQIGIAAFEAADVKASSTGHPDLDWTRVGSWSTGGGFWDYDDTVGRTGVFVTGYATPASTMPATGSATYAGRAEGTVFVPATGSGSTHCRCVIVGIGGLASFTANFGARTLAGTLTGMWAGGDPWFDDPDGGPWNSVNFNSTISGNGFSGTAFASTAPGGLYSMSGSATGTIEGKFFGPSAQEAGAVWTLFDGTRAAIGTLSGKR